LLASTPHNTKTIVERKIRDAFITWKSNAETGQALNRKDLQISDLLEKMANHIESNSGHITENCVNADAMVE
jgi:hypothetical protein